MTVYGKNPQVLNIAPPQFNVPGTQTSGESASDLR
jgi:hypothetical protein